MKKQNLFREFLDIYQYHKRWNEEHALHNYNNVYKKTIRDLNQFGLSKLNGIKVLDLGCGSTFPFSLAAAAEGAKVTALDLSYVKPDILPFFFVNLVKYNGLKRAFKSLARRLLFDKDYFKHFDKVAGIRLKPFIKSIKFIISDPHGTSYPLPDNTFDLIVSNAVLEHVGDVNQYFLEVNRLLNKGGLFSGRIHNFYSISGGHFLEWSLPDTNPSQRVPPWDHLRKNLFPTHIYLNKLKPEDFKNAAEKAGLEILLHEGRDVNHDGHGLEGEKFLTSEVREELSQYPRELLLTRAYSLICRKK
ncbi:MAG: class I SAM-dependent methyltransferase [Ginsengibacter sp.]